MPENNIFNNNPLLSGMDPQKLQFLMEFSKQKMPTNMKEAMPFLLANMSLARKQNISFEKPEVELLTAILTKDLPPEEQERVKKMLTLIEQMNRKSAENTGT
jgi:hypothetical protein